MTDPARGGEALRQHVAAEWPPTRPPGFPLDLTALPPIDHRLAGGAHEHPAIYYPPGEWAPLRVHLDARNRRAHLQAPHRPWTARQLRDIAQVLTATADWLDTLPPPALPPADDST